MLFSAATSTHFRQLDQLLRQMTETDYQQPIPELEQASIGQHVRHILEFYGCLLGGCDQGRVSYENRPRDLRLESSPQHALAYLAHLERGFAGRNAAQPLCLEAVFGHSTPEQVEVHTSLEREIVYLAEHTVHHLAIIAIGLRTRLPHVQVPPHLGVAESTLRARAGASAA